MVSISPKSREEALLPTGVCPQWRDELQDVVEAERVLQAVGAQHPLMGRCASVSLVVPRPEAPQLLFCFRGFCLFCRWPLANFPPTTFSRFSRLILVLMALARRDARAVARACATFFHLLFRQVAF